MRLSRTAFWFLVAFLGVALMGWSHRQSRGVDEPGPWSGAVMAVAEEGTPPEPEAVGGLPVVVRFLPPGGETDTLAETICGANRRTRRAFLRLSQEKLVLLPDLQDRFTGNMLAWGRLPAPGSSEVLAGAEVARKDEVTVNGRPLPVVGILRKTAWTLTTAYCVPDHPATRDLFDPADDSVKQALLFNRAEMKKLADRASDLFPRDRFTLVAGMLRLERGPYYTYLAGMLLLLTGGSTLLIGGFIGWSNRSGDGWIGSALAEIRHRQRLFCWLHVIYFGLCLAGMLAIYEAPDVQQAMLVTVQDQVQSGSGLLGIAGWAYQSKSIPLAAAVTLGINFLAGSFAVITLPSLVVPGIGTLLVLWRAVLWGVLLAPTMAALSGSMVPHSLCLLLEGEGYILAAFFALLVPIYLVRGPAGTSVASRWGRAIVINLKGNLLVLLVLAVAAIYEATEVILQM